MSGARQSTARQLGVAVGGNRQCFLLLLVHCTFVCVCMPDSLAALKTCVQLWCRKLDDTEFRNPFDRAYVRVVEDREGGGGGGGGGRGGEPGQQLQQCAAAV